MNEKTNHSTEINKINYILLSFLFGWMGAHKFYEGEILKGIIYLVFSWTCIPFVIGLIEGLHVCFMEADEDGNVIDRY